MSDELSPKQAHVVSLLPVGSAEIADELGVSRSTAKDHIAALRKKDVTVKYDQQADVYYLAGENAEKIRRVSTKHKATKTREANSLIEAEESVLLRRLKRTEPLAAPKIESPEKQSFVAIISDTHFGDLVEDEHGNVIYNNEIAHKAVDTFAEKCLYHKEKQSQDTEFEDCHLFILGDAATGTGIYEGQVFDVESFLADQVTNATQAFVRLATTLSEGFETLHIHCVLGNHGKQRAAAHRGSNTDLIVYRWLDDALRRDSVDNVSMNIAESTHHLNTEIRGWSIHARHGQDGMMHVDKTSRSESDWRGWRDKHQYDLAMRGHYHVPALDYVLNTYPVFTAPSPKPGGEFIDRIGSPDASTTRQLGWCFGMSDKRRVTFKQLVDDFSRWTGP